MNKAVNRQRAQDVFIMTCGIILSAIGVYFFKFPNHFSTGGVTGIAVVAARLIPGWSVTAISNLLNIALLFIGILVVGRDFGMKTVYCTLLLTALLAGFERFVPIHHPLTDQPLMELAFAMLLSASGVALLFHVGASSGGTDVVAMVLRKYTHVYNISTALVAVDFLAAMATFLVFDVRTGLFSLLGLLVRGALLQGVLNALKQRKYFHIITGDTQVIRDFIVNKLHRSATIFEGHGAYTWEKRTLITAVVSTQEAVILKEYVKKHSPQSFLLITNTNDIIGKGFRNAV